jgi:hypothetical protein
VGHLEEDAAGRGLFHRLLLLLLQQQHHLVLLRPFGAAAELPIVFTYHYPLI